MGQLPDPPDFRSGLKGYVREEVDGFIRDLQTEAAAAVAGLEQRLAEADSREAAATERAYFYILDVRSRLLADANSRARKILHTARDLAADMRLEARDGLAGAADPEELLASARRRAEEVLSSAHAEAELIQSEARETIAAARDERHLLSKAAADA
ncbi:MAG: hypothetical protein V3W06_07885, partial [Acidimicrobiia bacterium]